MSSKKKVKKTSLDTITDSDLGKYLTIITLGYILVWAVFTSLLGKSFATLITPPLWGISLFILKHWYDKRKSGEEFYLTQVLLFPVLNYRKILLVILSIVAANIVFGSLTQIYLYKTRPEFVNSTPDDFYGVMASMMEDGQATILILVGGYISHTVGGFIAGILPNKNDLSPYPQAFVGSIIYGCLNFTLVIPLLFINDENQNFIEEDLSILILAVSFTFVFALLGTWLALRVKNEIKGKPTLSTSDDKLEKTQSGVKNANVKTSQLSTRANYQKRKKNRHLRNKNIKQKLQNKSEKTEISELDITEVSEQPRNSKIQWLRLRSATLFVSLLIIFFISIVVYLISIPSPVECPNPPATATLNYWSVGYGKDIGFCQDYPPVDAKLVGEGTHYSQNRQEWERGLTAKAGEEIYILIYINNGATLNAENLNPGRGIARDIELKTEIVETSNSVHLIKVRFAGKNTNTVESSFKITTSENERLEVVSQSGELYDYRGSLITKNLNIGNNNVLIGDLPPKWEDSLFIRFRVRII